MTPYVYKIENKETGEFYIGSRTSRTMRPTPEEDFMVYYFSSGVLAEQCKNDPSKFNCSIIFRYDDKEVVYWYEQLCIRETINSSKCVNRHYIDPDTSNRCFSMHGKKHRSDTIEKMRLNALNRTDEVKKRASDAQKGKVISQETRKKISESVKKIAKGHPKSVTIDGLTFSSGADAAIHFKVSRASISLWVKKGGTSKPQYLYGDDNPSRRPEVRQKISDAKRAK